jgi:hypothetical protein
VFVRQVLHEPCLQPLSPSFILFTCVDKEPRNSFSKNWFCSYCSQQSPLHISPNTHFKSGNIMFWSSL